jgi:ketosteroid isomerase-like protein
MGQAAELWARAWDAVESGRLEALGELFTADALFWTPSAEGRGADYVRGVLARHLSAWPDLEREVVAMIEAPGGEAVAIEVMFTGTHLGELRRPGGDGVIAPTGRRLRWAAADHVRVAGGRIVAWRAYFDRLPLLEQLQPPVPAPAASAGL